MEDRIHARSDLDLRVDINFNTTHVTLAGVGCHNRRPYKSLIPYTVSRMRSQGETVSFNDLTSILQ